MVLSSICWEKSCGFSVKILFDCWRYTPGLSCIRDIWENNIDLSTKLSLTNRGNINPQQSVHHPVSTLTVGNEEYSWSFQNKLVCSSFKWVSKYILFLPKLKGEGVISWSKQGEYRQHKITRENIPLSWETKKVSPFAKVETILSFHCYLVDPLSISTAGYRVLWQIL